MTRCAAPPASRTRCRGSRCASLPATSATGAGSSTWSARYTCARCCVARAVSDMTAHPRKLGVRSRVRVGDTTAYSLVLEGCAELRSAHGGPRTGLPEGGSSCSVSRRQPSGRTARTLAREWVMCSGRGRAAYRARTPLAPALGPPPRLVPLTSKGRKSRGGAVALPTNKVHAERPPTQQPRLHLLCTPARAGPPP